MAGHHIHPAGERELRDGARLLADALGFHATDAIPAWLMHATSEAGGIALAAAEGSRVVGFSYAVCGVCPDRHLFSCGLAIVPERRGSGLGRALKLVQRDMALERGFERIRWTADPLAAPALRLYLSRLGAQLVEYRPGLYEALRPSAGAIQDDVLLEWPLRPLERPSPAAVTGSVEIPYDHAALAAPDAYAWRRRVREQMCARCDAGETGVAVDVDRGARRCWVRFAR